MEAVKVKQILISGFLLWLFSVVGTTLVAVTQQTTAERIVANEKKVLMRNLHALLPADKMDNDMTQDVIGIEPTPLLGTHEPTLAYRARKQGEPVAIVLNAVAPGGYNGDIHLLIGIYVDGSVAGVRVVKHNETPGLGDGIEIRKSNWILGFDGKSLSSPPPTHWKVKRDGGDFDQMTGATITPRAIVKAVKNALEYFQQNQQRLFQ
jgi:electron transport complex protein RnfG